MLVTKDEMEKIVCGCDLAATAATTEYRGKELFCIRAYTGKYGAGYKVMCGGQAHYYVYPDNTINKAVYAGYYHVADACMTANNCRQVRYAGVQVTPMWQLDLDTVSGDTVYRRVEEYKPANFAGRTLSICWRGPMNEKDLRARIRRKLRDVLKQGKAKLV